MGPAFEIKSSDTASAAFVDLPYELYRGEPAWRAPLRMERRDILNPKKNPSLADISRRFFIAERSGETVGRIVAFTNAAHDAEHGPGTAFFGFFDCVDDTVVEDALLGAATDWAVAQGRSRVVGPAMWSVNEEVGLLVDGFEHPNAILMPYGRAHQIAAVERNGFTKAVDLYAYLADLTNGAPKGKLVKALCKAAERDDRLTWRPLDTRDFMGDVRMAYDIFNFAWAENWGFIPFSWEQFAHMAKEMRIVMFRDGFQIGFIDGEPAAFIWMIPDVNEVARGLDGKLLPFGWATFLARLKGKRATKGRVPLMGLKPEFQKGRRGVALTTKICSEAFDAGMRQGFSQCELSWVLEDNESMKGICDIADAAHYKTYRMYERDL